MSNCVIAGNAARSWGGGAYCGTLVSCVLRTNLAGYYDTGGSIQDGGGGAYAATLINCLISSNSTGGAGGGVAFSLLTNSILEYNSSWGRFCGGAYNSTLVNCTVVSNTASTYGGGAANSILDRCQLINNSADILGGGAFGCTLSNCFVAKNYSSSGGGGDQSVFYNCVLATNSATSGGGASSSSLYNCLLTGNSAQQGGGSSTCDLRNCTLVGNSATQYGGGMVNGRYWNCIVYYNTAPVSSNYYTATGTNPTFTNCCTMPLPVGGKSNFITAPSFVDKASGNFRLQTNSPCINAGNSSYVINVTDLDGRARIAEASVDLGAYEYQPGINGAFIHWLEESGLPSDGSADYFDPDGDSLNNWEEWRCGTDPLSATSVLKLLPPVSAASNSVVWQSVTGTVYFVQCSTNLLSSPAYSIIGSNIAGQSGTTIFVDTSTSNTATRFYRVGVR